MKARFTEEKGNLSDIKILANVEGFIIFERDGVKECYNAESFISTFIEACRYKLVEHDFDYKGYLVIYQEGEYVIGDPIGFSCSSAGSAMAVIDFYHRNDTE